MTEPKYKPGATVTWTSQANGCHKSKTGKVIAFIPAGTRVDAVAPFIKDEPPARRSALGSDLFMSSKDRYLIAVPRPISRTRRDDTPNYYAPYASVVDRGAPSSAMLGGDQ